MTHGGGVLVLCAAVTVAATGCGSMGAFAKEEAEIDVRVRGVENRVDDHERRVDDHEQRITTLETSVVQTADVAREALDHADVALVRTDIGGGRAASLRAYPGARPPRSARALLGSVHVLFGFNSSDLDKGAQRALASVIEELRQNPGLTVDLEGATDSKGARGYNMQLSQRRVEAVRRYLLRRGVLSLRILHSTAVGPLEDPGVPEEQKRRVTVKLMKLSE